MRPSRSTFRPTIHPAIRPTAPPFKHAPLWLLTASLCWPLMPAGAQSLTGPLPTAAEPGREALRLPEPQRMGAAGVAVPQTLTTRAPAGAEALRFTATAFAISGVTAYPAESLRPLYESLLGTEITVARAFEVASAIELRYRNAGFVTSRVIVPQQTIEAGVFKIVVVEGYISEIVNKAALGPADAAVQRLLAPLRGVRPISLAEIERRLLLANELPGLSVRATLEPSPTEQGGSVLVVEGTHRDRDVNLSLSSRTSPYLGKADVGASLALYALGERADRLSLNLRGALPFGRSASVGAAWDGLLSADGLSAGLSTHVARSEPGLELDALGVRSLVQSGTGTLTYPLIRSRLENLRLVGEFELRNVNTDLAGARFTRDRLRIARFGLSYDRTDDWDGITAVRVTLHQGLDFAGASRPGQALASRAKGQTRFTKLTTELTRVQQLQPRTSLVGSLAAQWTPSAMLASEEMALGGSSFGRAYNDGEISADRGIAAALELRYSPALDALPQGAQTYAFADGGRLSASKNGVPLDRTDALASFGVGARANLASGLMVALEVAKPLKGVVRIEGNKNPRFFLSVSAQF
ncbi:ShlB/FhaC/HecB family hemolysin secretion/activation protein [Ideonella sp.]|uniref:ShlB/FhaC/HecB family hemolysin secretion/activation protein n=1 Tax=Ideonella sp. TaxID=1929293 RepID=UPI003BB77DE2